MDQQELDRRIAQTKLKKNLGPEQVADGTERLPVSSPAASYQIDSTYREDDSNVAIAARRAAETDEKARREQVKHIRMPDNTPGPGDTVSIGRVRIERNMVEGWEKVLTQNPTAFNVYLDDEPVASSLQVEAIFLALQAAQQSGKGGKR